MANILDRKAAELAGWKVSVVTLNEWLIQCTLTDPNGKILDFDKAALNPDTAEDVMWDWYLDHLINKQEH